MITLLGTLALSGVTITLPMEAHVRGTEVRVGQVAEVSGPDPAVVAAIEDLSLGYAPSPGFSRLIWNHAVAELVADHDPSVRVSFVGERATRVWPVVERISAEDLTAAAEARVAEAAAGGDWSWTLREPLRDVEVPATSEPARLVAKPARGSLAGGVLSVPVEVRVGGETYRTLWSAWDVRGWETVPVLTRPVPAGRRVQPDLLRNERVPARSGRAGKPLSREMLLGAMAVRDLVPGDPVTELDVNRPPVVTTGDSIFLEVRKGPIAARVPAIARQSGAIGDRIRVLRSDAPSVEMSAVVVSRDLVEVDLSNARL